MTLEFSAITTLENLTLWDSVALVPGELTMQRFWVKWAPSPGLVVLSVGCTLESPGELKNHRHLPSTSKDFHFIGCGGVRTGHVDLLNLPR